MAILLKSRYFFNSCLRVNLLTPLKYETALFLLAKLFGEHTLFAQSAVSSSLVTRQIKRERDSTLSSLTLKLQNTEPEISDLTNKLASNDIRKTADRITALEQMQVKHAEKINLLEAAPIAKIQLNGQLAFAELISIPKDISPADLFLSSTDFFRTLSSIEDLQKYQDFTTWETQYNSWYQKQEKKDEI